MAQGLSIGTTLRGGSYRIERILGQGGFGITYLAVDVALDRKVAIKEFFPKDYCDRDGSTSRVSLGTQNTEQLVNRLKAKFIKEARNIAKFDHPGIIKIHAAFEENNTAYYVMDLIEGESLSAMVKREGPLPEDIALRYITKVGKALEYVHAHRMNHLDVKPANIMVRKSDDEPVLIDFGLSKQYDTEGGQTSTTPTGISHGYAPLEQYNDGGVSEFSPQTDLYSLAATLYYILSGIVPPQATRLNDEELTFPASIPARLVSPIAKAMSPARRGRHESIRSFLEEISEDSDNTQFVMPLQPQPETTGEQDAVAHPAPKSGKWRYIIVAAVVAVAVALTIVLWPKGASADKAKEKAEVVDSTKIEMPAMPRTVNGIYYKSSLGACSYSGEVDDDGKPNGRGKAEWESGVAKSYDGEWLHGDMDGDCIYMSRGGYRFEGKFKSGHYSQGKLISPDNRYYEGTFDKDGNILNGTDYDSEGNKIYTYKNGE